MSSLEITKSWSWASAAEGTGVLSALSRPGASSRQCFQVGGRKGPKCPSSQWREGRKDPTLTAGAHMGACIYGDGLCWEHPFPVGAAGLKQKQSQQVSRVSKTGSGPLLAPGSTEPGGAPLLAHLPLRPGLSVDSGVEDARKEQVSAASLGLRDWARASSSQQTRGLVLRQQKKKSPGSRCLFLPLLLRERRNYPCRRITT